MGEKNQVSQVALAALIDYDTAAALLGVQRTSVKQLVQRGRLHSVPAPEDRRRRKLLRSEVQEYAQSHAGKWSYASDSAAGRPSTSRPRQGWNDAPPPPSPQMVAAGAASVGAAALLIAAFRDEADDTARLLIIGALIGIVLLLLLEWRRQGKIDAAQSRHMEKLTKQAEATPDTFVAELEQLLTQVG